MTALDICKQALAYTGTRTTITSLSDGSAEANYCSLLYAPLRDFLLREGDYDFSMKDTAAVAASAHNSTVWTYSYDYPDEAIRIRQLIPLGYNPLGFAPVAVEWNILNALGFTFIVTNREISRILYTFVPDEQWFDAIFRESLARLLSSALDFALTNRIEASDKALKEALSFAGIANLRDS